MGAAIAQTTHSHFMGFGIKLGRQLIQALNLKGIPRQIPNGPTLTAVEMVMGLHIGIKPSYSPLQQNLPH